MMAWPEGRIEFACTLPAEGKGPEKRWPGEVSVKRHGLNMAEFLIYGGGRCINAVVGKYMGGQYICIPDIDAGCALGRLSDTEGNRERLCAHMDKADAITVAHALRALSGYTGRDWI